jgi:hypothetical protein
MHPSTPPSLRPGAVPCHPAGTLTMLLFALACTVAACDLAPAMPDVPMSQIPAPASAPVRRSPLAAEAYIGDEYADVQRALRVDPGEAGAPTF